ncbi:MAG: ABC transporter permease [Myxococcales bacterium]|nr:ABC transporter permease [Myxococcales bacterium]
MLRGVVLRSASLLATWIGAIALLLALLVTAPGDPIDLIPNGEELREQLEADWGLDRPVPARFALYLKRMATLDLGTSIAYRPGQPVVEVIRGPALGTMARVLGALTLAMVWGTALAWASSGALDRRLSATARRAVQAMSILPVFLIAHGTVTMLNEATYSMMEAGTIDRPSWFALPDEPSTLRSTLAIVALAVGSGALMEVHAQIEEAIRRIRSSPYVEAARARGAPIWPHIVRNLVPPFAATFAERAAFIAGSVVIIEKVLLLNGLGSVLWESALQRDYDLALAIALIAAAFVSAVALSADVVRLVADPRLRATA